MNLTLPKINLTCIQYSYPTTQLTRWMTRFDPRAVRVVEIVLRISHVILIPPVLFVHILSLTVTPNILYTDSLTK
jgi:hypothetical protein